MPLFHNKLCKPNYKNIKLDFGYVSLIRISHKISHSYDNFVFRIKYSIYEDIDDLNLCQYADPTITLLADYLSYYYEGVIGLKFSWKKSVLFYGII